MNITEKLKDRIFSLGLSIVLLCIVMAIVFPGKFATVENFSQLMLNLSIDTIVAVGMMVLMIAGMFDLSVDLLLRLPGAWLVI